jgi:hypothetical protein
MHVTNSKLGLASSNLFILLLGAKIIMRVLEKQKSKKQLLQTPNPCPVSLKIQ